MYARRKLLAILKRTTLAICLLLFACAGISGARMVYYEGRGWGFRLDEGIITAHWGFASPGTPPGRESSGLSIQPMTTRLGFRFLWPRITSSPDGRTVAYLPIWILLTPLAVATGLLWWIDRRRIPSGHCRRCGYNLTGNISGRCPECGTACELNAEGK
jgi:hypothetical protein